MSDKTPSPPPQPKLPSETVPFSPESISIWQSPLKLQAHVSSETPPIVDQLKNECKWLRREGYTVLCVSQPVLSQLQDGPQCGMVAAWLAGQCLHPLHSSLPTIGQIQQRAIQLGFSAYGEMFSAKNMEKLLCDVFNCRAEARSSFGFDVARDFQKVVEIFLRDKRLILIPYDADSDQRPGLRKGHKAHWALLSGFAVALPSCDKRLKFKSEELLVDERGLQILDFEAASSHSDLLNYLASCKQPKEFYFVARQSKSRRIFLFSAKDLAESNSNLVEFSRGERRPSHMQFILPPGGIKQGLAGQYVIIG